MLGPIYVLSHSCLPEARSREERTENYLLSFVIISTKWKDGCLIVHNFCLSLKYFIFIYILEDKQAKTGSEERQHFTLLYPRPTRLNSRSQFLTYRVEWQWK